MGKPLVIYSWLCAQYYDRELVQHIHVHVHRVLAKAAWQEIPPAIVSYLLYPAILDPTCWQTQIVWGDASRPPSRHDSSVLFYLARTLVAT